MYSRSDYIRLYECAMLCVYTGTMVPQPCPNGTYTPPDVGGLQNEKECLACPPGKFCRLSNQLSGTLCSQIKIYLFMHFKMNLMEKPFVFRGGQIRGLCAAGYLCISGSLDFTPQSPVMPNTSQCEWGVQCAGPCPAGRSFSKQCRLN